jgi:hypothetical protein
MRRSLLDYENCLVNFAGVSKFPQDVDELHFQVVGVIKDVDRLKSLFDLFAAVLDQLCRMGSVYKQEAGIEL